MDKHELICKIIAFGLLCVLLTAGTLIAPVTAAAAGNSADQTTDTTIETNGSIGIGVDIKGVMLNATVTIGNSILINPNEKNESDIIKSTSIKIRNESPAPIDVDFKTIEYKGAYINTGDVVAVDGPNNFASYTKDRYVAGGSTAGNIINWAALGKSETYKTIAFAAIDGSTAKDMLPDSAFHLCSLSSKFNEEFSEKEFEIDVKAGYSWFGTNAYKYNILLVLSVSEDDFR